jgi:succinate dehydrogenase/fumarate reductase iron-sulfur protein
MKVNIKRNLEGKVWFENYEIDIKDNWTILDLLDYLKYKLKSTLSYRSFCRSAICGTCAVKVNDKTILACKTKAKDIAFNDEIIIEAVDRSKIIRDLVVDHSFIEKELKRVKAYFVDEIRDDMENLQTPEEFRKIEKQTDCILCGACYFECEGLDGDKEFAGPFAFTKVFRFAFDSRDKKGLEERIKDAKEAHLYSCINCQKCVMVCPKGIASAIDITMLQQNDKNSNNLGFDNLGFGFSGGFF